MEIEKLEELLGKKIIEAYTAGMSVMEITKAIRKSRVEYVHGLLRDTGYIPGMIRSEYHRAYDIDCRLVQELKGKGCSFGRWCLGWKFDIENATAALKSPPDEAVPSPVHAALQRDLPWIYFKIYGGCQPQQPRGPNKASEKRSVNISWDDSCNGYIAKVIEQPEIEGSGYDWAEALERMSFANHFHENISRLNNAISKISERADPGHQTL